MYRLRKVSVGWRTARRRSDEAEKLPIIGEKVCVVRFGKAWPVFRSEALQRLYGWRGDLLLRYFRCLAQV